MKFCGWYAISVGIVMIGQWVFFISMGQVPELQSEPLRIAFHLASEGITAILLILSGVGVLQSWKSIRIWYHVACGMLLYSVIVSPGYFAQLGQWSLVVMFALLGVATVSAIVVLERKPADTQRS
jgi:hypothetical protein